MAKTATITMRVKPAIKQRLRALAKVTDRSEAYLAQQAQQAIAEYLGLNEWQVKEIKGDQAPADRSPRRRAWSFS